jgi:dTMP kinase
VNGLFITIEGPEGSGKTTQAKGLAERMRSEAGLEVVCCREPGGTRTGEAIRHILQHEGAGEPLFPETEALLFAASRAQLVRAVILPALDRGACVICDRFADSTTAYQGFGRGFGVDTMLSLNAFAVNGAVPDVTILLDIDVKAGFDRVRRRNISENRGEDRIEREELEFHQAVRAGYLALAGRWPERYRIVDSSGDPDQTAARVWEVARSMKGRKPCWS